ncbi:MAG: type II toxin-antitoxin system VapB family antitoxin [Acidimicrobiales bacterium]
MKSPEQSGARPSRSRTNIEIDDERLATVMRRYGLATKTDAVDLALRHLAGQPLSRSEALSMRGAGAIGQVPSDVPIGVGPDDRIDVAAGER